MTEYAEEPDQETRIERLRDEIVKLGGTFSSEPDVPADLEEEFLRQILAYEQSQPIALLEILQNGGLEVPAPDDLDNGPLTDKLWEVIERLASMGAYLLHHDD